MKRAHVILAFHAHEPLWDLPNELIALVDDPEIRDAIRGENYVLKRAGQERDIYAHLVQTAEVLGAPVTLDITNELLVQLAWYIPETFQSLAAAYKNGVIYPLYTHAHHTHTALLTPDEIADELRLNLELLHKVMGIPEPRHRGAFPTEGSVDTAKLAAYKDSGMEYIVFPQLGNRKIHFAVDGKGDIQHRCFIVGPDMLALPRHFSVSQHIWRPITRYDPKGVKNQGYILGRYWVFAEEYRDKSYVPFPISWEEAVAEYSAVLEAALREVPDRGLILYVQDLELMDFGDIALLIMEQAWKNVIGKKIADVSFVTPDDYLESLGDVTELPRVRFNQISWAPEIRLVLRHDGHYTPRSSGEFRGVDIEETVFKPLPFVLWEPGRFLISIYGAILDAFGMPRRLAVDAGSLHDTRYAIPRFDFKEQVGLHYRLMKRACNWGWRPEEGRQKRPFLHGYRLSELLVGTATEDIAFAATRYVHPGDATYMGAERILESLLGTRFDYLRTGIEKGGLAGENKEAALLELERGQSHRVIAIEFIRRAAEASRSIESSATPDGKGEALNHLIRELKGYCREVFLATDHVQRAWGCINDIESMILIMYQHLYEIYPPKFPLMLRELLPQEWEARQHPKLL
ncbi:MAG: glycoside hydrolase [Dehalococcoidia bacterium]